MIPSEIIEYCDNKNPVTEEFISETAICPYCSVDAIVPNSLVNYTQSDLEKWHVEGWGQERLELQKKYAGI